MDAKNIEVPKTPRSSSHGSPCDQRKGGRPSPISVSTSPSLNKQPSVKANCLCSPTTHVGSFRCRRHRNSMLTGGSVGSGLAELAKKFSTDDNDVDYRS
ncbi:hypothetical protein H6P81_008465 [Aristolochia fimbriata]|uniref:Uncharacterized protein n=1 Tax=Aristolochia fimbriata TaxID=158543 RepID=A0AAV7EI25_ARIFI|nr:hypothetical protein H6P81_008465 [Aristolochia fimbriata]